MRWRENSRAQAGTTCEKCRETLPKKAQNVAKSKSWSAWIQFTSSAPSVLMRRLRSSSGAPIQCRSGVARSPFCVRCSSARGCPVSKDALMQAAWPGLAVEENNLTVQIAALRRVLGDKPGADRWIETLPRRGYRFVGPVAASNGLFFRCQRKRGCRRMADKPSIAVLPFQNMSEASDQDYFADGMVEDIITELSRIRRLFVIARNSTFTYKGRAVDVRQVGKELGVRYVLEGSVRKARERIRITAAIAGCQLWRASLGRAFRWHDRGCLRASG